MTNKDLIERTNNTNTNDKTGRKAKKDALDPRQYELFLDGIRDMKPYYGQHARFAAFMLGRIGLRPGELVHMKASWVDYDDQMIEVPRQQDCEKGRDGGECGHCVGAAKQMADYHDDISVSDAMDVQWAAKTENAARRVYYGWCPRATITLERFFGRYDEWPVCLTSLHRRVDRATELAEDFNPDRMYPHCLRATAGTFVAGRGLGMMELKQMMGWSCLSTAKHYIADSPVNTARELDRIHAV